MSGMSMGAETAFRIAEDCRKALDDAGKRESLMIGALLLGRGGTLFGKPVEFEVRWPEGRPFGMSEEELRRMGEEIFTKAGGTL